MMFYKNLVAGALFLGFFLKATLGWTISPGRLTILNSTGALKKPCVVASKYPERSTSLSKMITKLNNDNCTIQNSPKVQLLLFKPKDLNDDAAATGLIESIGSRSTKDHGVMLQVAEHEHVIIAGYKVLYKEGCLGKDCDAMAWGGCQLGFLNQISDSRRYDGLDYDFSPSDCDTQYTRIHSFAEQSQGPPAQVVSYAELPPSGTDYDMSTYQNQNPYVPSSVIWWTFPWQKYVIKDDLDPQKIPIFDWQKWEEHKKTVIYKADDGVDQYRAKIVVGDGATMHFAVAEGAKLSLRYLDIVLKDSAHLKLCGRGMIIFTGVHISGGTKKMIEICDDPGRQPKLYFSPNRGNPGSYGLELSANDGTQSYFSGGSSLWILRIHGKGLRLSFPANDSEPPVIFSRMPKKAVCEVVEEHGSDEVTCRLSGSDLPRLVRGVVPSINVNKPDEKFYQYQGETITEGLVELHKNGQYFLAGKPIEIKGASPSIDCSSPTGFTRLYCDTVRGIQGAVRNVVENGAGISEEPAAPPANPGCTEEQHWEPAISACMTDEPSLPPDCGEAVWDTTTEDCECEEGKIYNSATKRCEVEEECTVDCGEGELPDADEGAETAGEDNSAGSGCSLQRGQVLTFHFLPGFLVFILFVLRHRARRIL